jgi:serpin B
LGLLKMSEKLEGQFDVCSERGAPPKQNGSSPPTAPRVRKFFLLGVLFELSLFAAVSLLPDGWLQTEIRNFVVIVHYPLLILFANADGALMSIFGSLLTLAAFGTIWGVLIYWVARLVNGALERATQRQRRLIKIGLCVCCFTVVAFGVISSLPATPISFTPSPEVKTVVEGNTTFGVELYQKLKDRPGNLFFSPFNISTTLAMTSAGARGQTEMEITNVLHLNLPPEKLHPAFKTLLDRMVKIHRWNRIVLKSANSFWAQKDCSFKPEFCRLVNENYFAETKSIDFKKAPAAAANEINRWVERKTSGRISSIAAANQFTPLTRLALCDAIYFKGKWQHEFKARDTKPALFHVSTNQTITVPMMSQKGDFKITHADESSIALLEMPYSGKDLSMIILLPRTDHLSLDIDQPGLSGLEEKLTSANLQQWLSELDKTEEHETWVALPRFTTTQSFDLAPELKSLGLKSAFDDSANFTGMDGGTKLFVSHVMHKAFVDVNESGTEAAAVTVVIVATKGMPSRFIVDRPFIFLIRENASGSILFLGRVIDPTK